MGFGHLYVAADQEPVIHEVSAFLTGPKGFALLTLTPERHPAKMKEIHEDQMRLYWISPRIGRWTGIHEFRYYSNEFRDRWGYTDEEMAVHLSRTLAAAVYRMEVVDSAGFWLYAKYEAGAEVEGLAHQDQPGKPATDPDHPRYRLNQIIRDEGIPNVGLSYENIPGPQVRPIENIRMWSDGIQGLEGFRHLAFARQGPPRVSERSTLREL